MKKEFTNQELIDELKKTLNNGKALLDEAGISLEKEMETDNPIETAKELQRITTDIKKSISGYVCGLKGENDAYEATRFIPDTIVLRNVQTPGADPERSWEHDLIFITKKGVFDCEVKYIGATYAKLTEQGNMEIRYANGRRRSDNNVAQQARGHRSSLYHLLSNTKFNKIRIVPMIMCANDNCTFRNEFEYIKTCYRNDAEYIIQNNDYADCLSEDEMQEIANIIKIANEAYEEKRYELPIDEESYYDAVNDFIAEHKRTYSISRRIGKTLFWLALYKLDEFLS